jgi:putative PIN family toxin of toxin-antitoxin system
VTSPAIIAGVRAVLRYPRIRNKYAITDEDVEGLVALLEGEAVVVPGEVEVENVIPEGPADKGVLACAVEAGADGIVSGDRHLLDLGEYRGIRILTVREFLEEMERHRPGGERG